MGGARLKAPNPYADPSLQLRHFQEEAIDFLLQRNRGLLALPTGTGKTITAFSTYSYLKANNPSLKLIYVTEKGLIPQTISQDLPTYFSKLTFSHIYNNSKPQRTQIYKHWTYHTDILILNYASLRIDFTELGQCLSKLNGNFITILDEATNFKSPDAQVSNCVFKICRASKHAYAMTATPASSGLYDIFNILKAIGEPPYKTKAEFDRFHCNYDTQKMFLFNWNGVKKIGVAIEEKSKKHRTLYFSLSKSFKISEPVQLLTKPTLGSFTVLNPNKGVFRWIVPANTKTYASLLALVGDKKMHCRVSIFDNIQHIGYKNLKSFRMLTERTMFVRSKKEIATELPALNVSYHPCTESEEVRATIAKLYASEKYSASQIEIALTTPQVYNPALPVDYISDKVAQLIYWLKNDIPNEKCIVYFPYTQATAIIVDLLKKHLNTNIAYICGETTDHAEQIDAFLNTDTTRILVGTATILKGLNLQSVDYIATLQKPYVFSNYQQLCGRINRIGGNNNPKFITNFITQGTRDEDISEVVLKQATLIQELNPKLVEEGIIPKTHKPTGKGLTESEARKELDLLLESRRDSYLTKKK